MSSATLDSKSRSLFIHDIKQKIWAKAMEGEFTNDQIDQLKEAFTLFDKGTSIYYVGIILDFCWPTHTLLDFSKTGHLLDPPNPVFCPT